MPIQYPLDFTFVCPTEITAFSDRFAEFEALNTSVAAISIDSKFSHLAWTNTERKKGGLGAMKIPLISDVTKSISKAYGVLVEDPADDMCGITLRSTVIINSAGKVVHISTNDAPVGRSVDEYIRLIQAFQYVDKHGVRQTFAYSRTKYADTPNTLTSFIHTLFFPRTQEVCPAGWRPGAASMKASPKGSLEYFASS